MPLNVAQPNRLFVIVFTAKHIVCSYLIATKADTTQGENKESLNRMGDNAEIK